MSPSIMTEMRGLILKRIVNSTVWIVSGIVVIIVRVFVTQGGSVLVWEIIGGGMIVFGAARLVWALIRSTSARPTVP